jgi:hypothetical protein
MATKKSTTKAKTKKSAKIIKSAKTSVKTTKQTKKSARDTHKKINVTSVFLGVISIALVYLFMSTAVYEVTVSYLVPNALEENRHQSAYRLFNELSLKFLLIATLFVGLIKPLFDLTRNKLSYQNEVRAGYMPTRFLDQGLQYSLFITITALLLGYQDLITVKAFAVIGIAVSLFAWLAEKNSSNKQTALQFNMLSGLIGLVLVIFFTFSVVFSYAFGQTLPSWHILLVLLLTPLYMSANILNQRKSIQGLKKFKDYKTVERNYLLVGVVARTNLAVILVLGFLK